MRRLIGLLSLVLGLSTSANAQLDRGIIYGDTTTNIPKVRTWNGTAWSSASDTLDVGGSPRWVVQKVCPTRTELIAAIGDNQNDLSVMTYNGTSWGSLVEVSTNLVTNAERPFDLAYEQTSGDALVVYRSGSTDGTMYYRTWNGSTWSAESSTTFPGTGSPKFIRLVPKAGSNEIMVVVLDSKKDISAMTWTGSAFANKVLLDSSTNVAGSEEFAAAYESSSGRCMVAWAVNGSGPPSYRVWSGSGWLTASSLPDVGGKTHWMRMASDPASNTIIAVTLDGGSDVNATVWNGSSWGAVSEFETSVPDSDRRAMDVAFESTGGHALVMYGRSAQHTVYYRTWNGSAWSSAQTGPDISEPPSVIQFLPATIGGEILIAIERKNDGALVFMRWTGSVLTGTTVLAADLGGPNGNECFMLGGSGGSAASTPRVVSWQEVAPSTP